MEKLLVEGFFNHKRNKEKQKAQSKMEGAGKRNALVDGFFNHKSHKRKKRNGGCWKAEPQKEQRKTKGTKKSGWVLGAESQKT